MELIGFGIGIGVCPAARRSCACRSCKKLRAAKAQI
jgi:hypothetical protein